ncbi:ABC-2 type transport system ATP-binding protein [Paenibacillus sophorae]|uniref:ABC transporter ATP-binding protein n=1 Tax=Paenibacillus sophorae TaxID=1333845 RepID=A0A1H8PJH3_9BACL|nr:ABC transporter ATP-binding protein [Paenibacillus sophorae]QWU16595.1 ABC transporter ATP-binding protein [Paenibacillus sophorae]SEO41921.1 ABC-2 type transport system ATP-binding protein [Paenibacillus sophorae]
MDTVIEVQDVCKTFKDKQAVNGVGFSIAQGSVTAMLGPNGAGKTTMLSMMLGLLEPTKGSVTMFGRSPHDKTVRERTGAMLQEVSVMERLKVSEILSLVRGYYPHPLNYEQLVQATGLASADLNRYADKLSVGQKRGLGFALALAGNPDLLFFDEPTVGLDIGARQRFWDIVRGLAAQGKTILFATHYLQEAEDMADRILLFNRGALAADGTPDEIKAGIVKRSVSFLSPLDEASIRLRLSVYPAIKDCRLREGRLHAAAQNTDEALAAIFASGIPAHDIRIDQGRLDDAFRELVMNHKEAI